MKMTGSRDMTIAPSTIFVLKRAPLAAGLSPRSNSRASHSAACVVWGEVARRAGEKAGGGARGVRSGGPPHAPTVHNETRREKTSHERLGATQAEIYDAASSA